MQRNAAAASIVLLKNSVFFCDRVGIIVKDGQKTTFSEVQRARTVALEEEGLFERQFSMKMGCIKTVVHFATINFTKFWFHGDKERTERSRKTWAIHYSIMKLTVESYPTNSRKKN